MDNAKYICPQCRVVLQLSKNITWSNWVTEAVVYPCLKYHQSDPYEDFTESLETSIYFCSECGYIEPHISQKMLKRLFEVEGGTVKKQPPKKRARKPEEAARDFYSTMNNILGTDRRY